MLGLKLLQHRVQVVATAVVDEEAAHVGLCLVPDHLRDRLEVPTILSDPLNCNEELVIGPPSVHSRVTLWWPEVFDTHGRLVSQLANHLLVVLHLSLECHQLGVHGPKDGISLTLRTRGHRHQVLVLQAHAPRRAPLPTP